MEDVINYLRKVRRGTMFIIEGPSGTGKGTVIKEILARDPHIKFSVSVTTRPPRKGEVNGVDYYFISDEEYDRLKTEDAFYEYVDSQYGSRYGTLRSEVDSFINVGEDVLFDLDWMGARQMKEKAGADAVTIYLLPPSIREVRRRLEGRGTDSREVIEKRMDLVLEKISHWNEFDYVVVNEMLDQAIAEIVSIVRAERLRIGPQSDRHQKLIASLKA